MNYRSELVILLGSVVRIMDIGVNYVGEIVCDERGINWDQRGFSLNYGEFTVYP